jgi:hypothetical protein
MSVRVDRRVALGALGASLLGGAAFQLGWCSRSESPGPQDGAAARPSAAPETRGDFVAERVTGVVERRAGEGWAPVVEGERLAPDAELRTAAGGAALLRSGAGTEIAVGEGVAIGVVEMSSTLAAFRLDRGRVEAKTGEAGQRVELVRGEAKAASAEGRFVVMATERGVLAVAVRSGEVRLVGSGHEVRVAEGQESHVPPGARPSEAVAIPEEVFLQVRWPEGPVAKMSVSLDGRVHPATRVSINGQPAAVDPAGGFRADVALAQDRTKLRVVAEDLLGRRRELTGEAERHVTPAAPRLSADPSQLWNKATR